MKKAEEHMNTFNIGRDFSRDPGGRFYADGEGNGEDFRENYLKPKIMALKEGEKLLIILDDGILSHQSSFMTEGFAGMVKYGYITAEELLKKLDFSYTDLDFEFYKNRIITYINQAKFNSIKYVPTEIK